MKEAPFTNPADSGKTEFIGTKMIRPGETRMVDAALVPGAGKADPATADTAPAREHNIQALQADSIKAITPQLPGLTDAQLAELLTLERAQDKPRRGVTEAVEEEQLKRESGKGESDETDVDDEKLEALREDTVDEITDKLPTLTDGELDRLQAMESADDEPRVTLIDAIGVERSNRQAPE